MGIGIQVSSDPLISCFDPVQSSSNIFHHVNVTQPKYSLCFCWSSNTWFAILLLEKVVGIARSYPPNNFETSFYLTVLEHIETIRSQQLRVGNEGVLDGHTKGSTRHGNIAAKNNRCQKSWTRRCIHVPTKFGVVTTASIPMYNNSSLGSMKVLTNLFNHYVVKSLSYWFQSLFSVVHYYM